jgi:hypothetical protein
MKNEIMILKEQNKDLLMRLCAIKTIVTKVNPVCSEKLQQLLDVCEGCKDGKIHEEEM